jgi:hypothetical protein
MRSVVFVLLLAVTGALGQSKRRDAALTDVSAPQPQYQVMTLEQGERIATQAQAVADVHQQLADIKQSIRDIQKDIEVLKQTNWVFGFIVRMFEILIPGLLCTWFGVWLAKRKPPRRPVKATAA